jgi:hypothetical protein
MNVDIAQTSAVHRQDIIAMVTELLMPQSASQYCGDRNTQIA